MYLIGCRAVGKSSIGKTLAQKLSYVYLDTDAMITEAHGQSVAEIVEAGGWQQFREYEREVLQELQGKSQCVVATGGGAILHSEVWPDLKKQGKVIWLTASLEVLCARIQNDHKTNSLRPSLTGRNVCRELEDVLAERSALYQTTADFMVDTGIMNVDEVVSQIEQYLINS